MKLQAPSCLLPLLCDSPAVALEVLSRCYKTSRRVLYFCHSHLILIFKITAVCPLISLPLFPALALPRWSESRATVHERQNSREKRGPSRLIHTHAFAMRSGLAAMGGRGPNANLQDKCLRRCLRMNYLIPVLYSETMPHRIRRWQQSMENRRYDEVSRYGGGQMSCCLLHPNLIRNPRNHQSVALASCGLNMYCNISTRRKP